MSASLKTEDLARLKGFIEICKQNPKLLWMPELLFFKEYIESFGGKIPQDTEDADSSKNEPKEPEPESQPAPEEVEMSSEESDVEIDNEGVIEPETTELPEMGDSSKLVSEEDEDAANGRRSEAMSVMSEDLDKAIELLTQAIILNPHSAAMHAKRANLLIKQKRVKAALADCDRAIEINQDYSSAYKFRGRAHTLLGNWIQAAKDLRTACKLDFDEQADEWLKEVQPKASKIEEHNRKYDRKKEEKKIKEAKERVRKAQEARKEEEKRNKSQEMPGGMGGMGGMDALFETLMGDPEIQKAMEDPEVSEAFSKIMQNPSEIMKYKDNPKVAKVLAKLGGLFGGSMPGGMPGGFPGGMPGGFPGGMPGGFPGGMPGGFPGGFSSGTSDTSKSSGPQTHDDLD